MALEIGQATQLHRIGNRVEGRPALLGPDGIFHPALWEHYRAWLWLNLRPSEVSLVSLWRPRPDGTQGIWDMTWFGVQNPQFIQAGPRPGCFLVYVGGRCVSWSPAQVVVGRKSSVEGSCLLALLSGTPA